MYDIIPEPGGYLIRYGDITSVLWDEYNKYKVKHISETEFQEMLANAFKGESKLKLYIGRNYFGTLEHMSIDKNEVYSDYITEVDISEEQWKKYSKIYNEFVKLDEELGRIAHD